MQGENLKIRETFVPAEYNVKYSSLVNPLHIKLGLMKDFMRLKKKW